MTLKPLTSSLLRMMYLKYCTFLCKFTKNCYNICSKTQGFFKTNTYLENFKEILKYVPSNKNWPAFEALHAVKGERKPGIAPYMLDIIYI